MPRSGAPGAPLAGWPFEEVENEECQELIPLLWNVLMHALKVGALPCRQHAAHQGARLALPAV